MALKVVRGRGVVGSLALAGAVLLAPAIVWPTWAIRVEEPDFSSEGVTPDGSSARVVVMQLFWSWGRFAQERTPPFEPAPPLDSGPVPWLGLVTRIVLVLLATIGAAVWLWARGERARFVGIAGIAAGWAAAVLAISGRVTFMSLFTFGSYEGAPTMDIRTFGAGTAENAALLILSVVLLLVLAKPGLGIAAAAWRKGSVWAAERRADDEADEHPRRRSVAVIRDASADELGRHKDGTLPGRVGVSHAPDEVGFSDAPPDDERFRPR